MKTVLKRVPLVCPLRSASPLSPCPSRVSDLPLTWFGLRPQAARCKQDPSVKIAHIEQIPKPYARVRGSRGAGSTGTLLSVYIDL